MKKNITNARPKFNKGNLNSNFFANAKKSNVDDGKGWAFDFDNPSGDNQNAQ
jgi:hypothetical protein